MEDLSEGCYCAQAQKCPHWIAAKMDSRMETVKEHSHARSRTFEQELQQEDHRPIVSELQRELRVAMLEIEKLAKTSRDLAKVNQELEESRILAISDQARTAKRLMLVSGQLEYTEQQLFNLTKEMDKGQKDSDLLRIERIKRETLQEREDESRLKIETLQDELQEVQRSERSLQQKLTMVQSKFETLSKRHENLKRQQQELELARESKEALAWLKETTDRLCSPPQGSLGQAIQQERSSHGSAAISIHRSSPSSSPPYPSSFIDPPLAAQNQLISLIKELATTNSTLRSELNEYRDLLQDTRNEMLALRSQVEDYEQGHAFDNCCGHRMDDNDSFRTSKSAWSTLDIPLGGGLDAVSHIGTLGSAPGSPPPYMTTPRASSRHHLHHHFHLSGVRGNVFGELERLYSQGQQAPSSSASKRHGQGQSSSKKSKRRAGNDHERSGHTHGEPSQSTTVSTSTSTSEGRSGSTPIMTSSRSPLNPTPSKLRDQYEPDSSSPTSNTSRSRRSMYTDADLDMLNSGTESGEDHGEDYRREEDLAGLSSGAADDSEGDEMDEPGFVARFAESELLPDRDTNHAVSSSRRSLALLPPASLLDPAFSDEITAMNSLHGAEAMENSIPASDSTDDREGPLKNRTSSISLLSAELQRATRSEAKLDLFSQGDREHTVQRQDLHPFEERHATDIAAGSSSLDRETDAIMEGKVHDISSSAPWSKNGGAGGRNRFSHHDKSFSDQGLATMRLRRRLSEPLHHQPSFNSLNNTKKSRPSSIYSLKRPRLRMESPNLHCIRSGHMASASANGVPGELQRCKSAELVEQIMSEQRHRMMEAWRVGVVAAAVTQQQSIHSVVAFGEQRKDPDNTSIRSKASRRRGKGLVARETSTKNIAQDVEGQGANSEFDGTGYSLPSKDSESTIREARRSEDSEVTDLAVVPPTPKATVSDEQQDGSPLTIDTASAEFGKASTFEPGRPPEDKMSKDLKRRSMRSIRSVRSPLLRSPLVRSPLQARDRRFPSEASTASEAFSNRRLDHEQSPYQLLHTLSTDLLERLSRSDTRELNRRLRRTFDIQALSQMSNSVIENVLTDVNNLGERFRWLEAQVADPIDELLERQPVGGGGVSLSGGEGGAESGQEQDDDESASDDDEEEQGQEEPEDDWGFSVAEFFPLANTVQEMLSEIGKLRMTINELQLSYVQKVEQDRIKAEKDFLQDVVSEEEDELDEDDHRHSHHHHHHHHHQSHLHPRMEQVSEKPAQLKNVLGMLDRPRILGSASTGVSGFFNKVFGGSGQPPNTTASAAANATTGVSEYPKTPAVQRATTMPAEASKDNPAISKSKSGLVVAETTRIFADSAWLSSPGKLAAPKTPNPSTATSVVVAETPQLSNTTTRAIFVPGSRSRLSATTSLAAMATMSPARSSMLHVTEGVAAAVAPAQIFSSTRTRAIDISFSPDTKKQQQQQQLSSAPRSPPIMTASPTALSVQGMLSRSLPQNQSNFGMLSSEGHTTRGLFAPSGQQNSLLSPEFIQSSSFASEEAKTPHTPSTAESPQVMDAPGSGDAPSFSSSSSSKTPSLGQQRALTMNKTPRSIGISTRSGGPALNVVTKQDIFQNQPQWAPSTASTLSATGTVSTEVSRANSERRGTGESIPGGEVAVGSEGVSVEAARKAASIASSNSGASENMSSTNVASRIASKPTLITRSALTVATPSTSTVSSPVSTTSWFDSRRFSGTHGQDTTGDGFPSQVPGLSFAAGLEFPSGSMTSTATSGDPQQLLRKPRALTSFHADAALGGSGDSSVTRSLGRASGRESALAFLRGEKSQASSILGSFFQSQSQQSQALTGQTPSGSPAVQRLSANSIFKGKGLAKESSNIEVLTGEHEEEQDVEEQEQGEYVQRADSLGIHESSLQRTITSSRSDTLLATTLSGGAPSMGAISTPTTSLSQRAAVTSTAVAYVVATPDDKDGGTPRKKRAVFDRDLIKASQKRILAGVTHQDGIHPGNNTNGVNSRPFVPEARTRRVRALSVDSAQSSIAERAEPLRANEIMDLWRVGAGVSRDIWRGLIKKVDGRDS